MATPSLPPALLSSLPAEVVALLTSQAKRITELEALVADLQARLGQNSSNSSKPPSSDGPHVKPAPPRVPSGKRPGGQPGHPRHERTRREPTRVLDVKPCSCGRCGSALAGDDPDPAWRQVVELPPVRPDVTEYRMHTLTCPRCGTATAAEAPPESAREYGPCLQASLSLLSVGYRLGKRSVQALASDLLGVEISTGQICALERETAKALEPVVVEAREYVQERPVNVDETSWKQGKGKAWLWVAVTRWVTVFSIALSRSRGSFDDLIGPSYRWVVTSDRYSVYGGRPPSQRQVCWAHLQRDFQAMIDRGGEAKGIGEDLRVLGEGLLRQWKRVRDGTATRASLQTETLSWLKEQVVETLQRGLACGCAKTAGTCAELLKVEGALWTFATSAGVEPTNNAAERALRHAVCWRKTSHGTASAGGSRYVERMLTVVGSCRQQGRDVLAFLTDCVRAERDSSARPSLLPVTP
jgi:transposase